MPSFLVGLLNVVQAIEILWFKKIKQLVSIAHCILKTLFLSQKYLYEILIGSCEKARVSCIGRLMSAWSIYSWSRVASLLYCLLMVKNNNNGLVSQFAYKQKMYLKTQVIFFK